MLNERQPRVHPADDDKAHITDMANWVQHRMQSGQPILPDTAQRLLQHSQGHAQAIAQKKDKEGLALVKQLQPLAGALQQIAQGGAPQQMPGGATVPGQMPQGPQMMGGGPSGMPPALNAPGGPPATTMPQSGQPTQSQEVVVRMQGVTQLDPATIAQIVQGVASVQKPIVVNSPPAQVKIQPAPTVMPPMVSVNVQPTPVSVDNKVSVPEDKAKTITLNRDKDGKITGAKVS
jgi:hypothetical protein